MFVLLDRSSRSRSVEELNARTGSRKPLPSTFWHVIVWRDVGVKGAKDNAVTDVIISIVHDTTLKLSTSSNFKPVKTFLCFVLLAGTRTWSLGLHPWGPRASVFPSPPWRSWSLVRCVSAARSLLSITPCLDAATKDVLCWLTGMNIVVEKGFPTFSHLFLLWSLGGVWDNKNIRGDWIVGLQMGKCCFCLFFNIC